MQFDPDGLRRAMAAALVLAIKDAGDDPTARAWLRSEDAAPMFAFFDIDPAWIDDEVIAAVKGPRHRRMK
jgi:hypothetical protein